MNSRAKNAESIFGEAIGIEAADDRATFLDQACADDPQLREEVEKLVADHFRAGSFMEEPALKAGVAPGDAATTPLPVGEQVGARIGPYKLLQVIGEGGMGVVYMAEQTEPVKRRVALKIIKPGMDSQQVLARFEAERQALAMMDHPNIARVLEAGSTSAGRPYFVMELVKGVPITEYCDQHKLTPRERLQLFVDVCHAVQHAHQKAIIHRDLKPSNVLVAKFDDRPVVKVIDFGVAKATNQELTERTMFTQFGQIVGTLEYMSPEQAQLNQLDIDTRSDVYSLGVLLYELLTGETPFDRQRLRSAAFDEVLRIIREEAPPRPSVKLRSSAALSAVAANRRLDPKKLGTLIKGDLDWIVMKALEKDRARRFESTASFAQDIQRFLDFAPIESRPPSTRYRFWRFARRHRVGLALSLITGIACFSVVLGAVRTRAANNERLATVETLSEVLFDHGVTLIMNAEAEKVREVIDRLEKVGADSLTRNLRAVQLLHEHKPHEAIELLEPVVQLHPQDAFLRAMLTDAYDQAGDIHKFISSFAKLKGLDTSELRSVQLVYAALAGIVEPKWGYKLADRAVNENPSSEYARLVRARMAANYVQRSFDPSVHKSQEHAAQLIEQALDDIDTLRLLYAHDERVPVLALSTYLFAANARRRMEDDRWRKTLHMADDVVSYLETHHPSGWERYFLAEFYRQADDGGDSVSNLWNQYYAAAMQDENDYHTNFFFALCHELGRLPAHEVTNRVANDPGAVFGKYGLGCWYALHGEGDQARGQIRGLIETKSDRIDAVNYALMILHLLGDEAGAIKLVNEYAATVRGNVGSVSDGWFDRRLFEFFASDLLKKPEERKSGRKELLRCAYESDYPAANASFAHWVIGLRHWALNQTDEAMRSFQSCVDTGQFEFPHHAWCRAILRK